MSELIVVDRLHFTIGESNGGERVGIDTTFLKREDDFGTVINTEISIQSYSNSATFNLCGAPLTPSILRDLANKIDAKLAKLQ